MHKIKFLILVMVLFTSFYSSAQAKIDFSNSDEVHQKMTSLMVRSDNVNLPDSVYQVLVDYAKKNNLSPNSPKRNIYVFKILLNNGLSVAERLYACDYFEMTNHDEVPAFVPMELINSIRRRLDNKLNNKKND